MLSSRALIKAGGAVHRANCAFVKMNVRARDSVAKLGNCSGLRLECEDCGAWHRFKQFDCGLPAIGTYFDNNRVVPSDQVSDLIGSQRAGYDRNVERVSHYSGLRGRARFGILMPNGKHSELSSRHRLLPGAVRFLVCAASQSEIAAVTCRVVYRTQGRHPNAGSTRGRLHRNHVQADRNGLYLHLTRIVEQIESGNSPDTDKTGRMKKAG